MFKPIDFDDYDHIQHIVLVDPDIAEDPSDFDYFGGVSYVWVPAETGGFFAGIIVTGFNEGGFEGTFFCINDEAVLLSPDECETITLRLAATGKEYDMTGAFSKAWRGEWQRIYGNTKYDLEINWSQVDKTGYFHFDLDKLDVLAQQTVHCLPYLEYIEQHGTQLLGLFDKFDIPHTYAWLPHFEKKLKRNRGLYAM